MSLDTLSLSPVVLVGHSIIESFESFDEASTERQAKVLEASVQKVRVVRLRNANHYVFFSHEEEVLTEIETFMRSLQ